MPRLDPRDNHLCFRIVFCGPGCGGKSTALQHVHASLAERQPSDLVCLATETGRTLFFDFLPIHLGLVPHLGRGVRFHLFTVPGQGFYEEARGLVLRDADGVAFIADSDPARMEANEESLRNLKLGAATWGLSFGALPLVFFYNKRDAQDAVPISALREVLNPAGRPEFEGIATQGKGVMPMLTALCDLVLEQHLDRVRRRQR